MQPQRHAPTPTSGFSLIEVMVALAILAVGITPLLIVRNNSIQDAVKASDLRRISILLQQKLGEIAIGLEKTNGGTFPEEGYRNFTWLASTRIQPVTLQADGKEHQVRLKEVTLVVKDRDGKYNQSVTCLFFMESPENAEEEPETDPKQP